MKKLIHNAQRKAYIRFRDFVENEKGATTFIEVLIILGVAILLAGVFIGFKDQIVKQVQDIVNGFTIG